MSLSFNNNFLSSEKNGLTIDSVVFPEEMSPELSKKLFLYRSNENDRSLSLFFDFYNTAKHLSAVYIIASKDDCKILKSMNQTDYFKKILFEKNYPFLFEKEVIVIPSFCIYNISEIPKPIEEKKREDDDTKTEISDISFTKYLIQEKKTMEERKKNKKKKKQNLANQLVENDTKTEISDMSFTEYLKREKNFVEKEKSLNLDIANLNDLDCLPPSSNNNTASTATSKFNDLNIDDI